jgi:hypothetical protein
MKAFWPAAWRTPSLGGLGVRPVSWCADYRRRSPGGQPGPGGLARRYDNWPVYDMLYVAVAERASTEFVTADRKLQACLAHLGWVRLVGPDTRT